MHWGGKGESEGALEEKRGACARCFVRQKRDKPQLSYLVHVHTCIPVRNYCLEISQAHAG